MEELNKKIAEWCGLDVRYVGDTLCRYNKELDLYVVIDFTTSLDACFEYIVQKLKLMYLTIWEGFEVHLAIHTPHDRYQVYIGKAETPALALCRAVEKLIDGS